MSLTITAIIVFGLTTLLCAVLKTYAVQLRLIDNPNDRSSHDIPTARGGGVAIFVSWSIGITILVLLGQINLDQIWLIWAVSILVAVGGFWDDYHSKPVITRLIFQLVLASFFVWQAAGLTGITIGKTTIPLGIFGQILSVLFVVWCINLYNFMDGINGLAAAQCISACVSIVVIKQHFEFGTVPWEIFLLLAVACIAFSFWNFPVAQLFMGDSGSAGLGMFFAAATLIDAKSDSQMLWIWLVLLGGFIFDATYTLIRRVIRRERLVEAHRTHVYQRLVISIGSHVPITAAYFLVSLLLLLPIAILISSGQLAGPVGFVIAYFVLGLMTLASSIICNCGGQFDNNLENENVGGEYEAELKSP